MMQTPSVIAVTALVSVTGVGCTFAYHPVTVAALPSSRSEGLPRLVERGPGKVTVRLADVAVSGAWLSGTLSASEQCFERYLTRVTTVETIEQRLSRNADGSGMSFGPFLAFDYSLAAGFGALSGYCFAAQARGCTLGMTADNQPISPTVGAVLLGLIAAVPAVAALSTTVQAFQQGEIRTTHTDDVPSTQTKDDCGPATIRQGKVTLQLTRASWSADSPQPQPHVRPVDMAGHFDVSLDDLAMGVFPQDNVTLTGHFSDGEELDCKEALPAVRAHITRRFEEKVAKLASIAAEGIAEQLKDLKRNVVIEAGSSFEPDRLDGVRRTFEVEFSRLAHNVKIVAKDAEETFAREMKQHAAQSSKPSPALTHADATLRVDIRPLGPESQLRVTWLGADNRTIGPWEVKL